MEKSRKCFPLSVIATFFVPASVVLFDHLSVSLALNYLFIFFELLHLTLVCSLFHALSFFCLQPFVFTQFKQMKKKQLVRTVSEIVAFKWMKIKARTVGEKQRDMKNENSRSVSHGFWMKVVQWLMFHGLNSAWQFECCSPNICWDLKKNFVVG